MLYLALFLSQAEEKNNERRKYMKRPKAVTIEDTRDNNKITYSASTHCVVMTLWDMIHTQKKPVPDYLKIKFQY